MPALVPELCDHCRQTYFREEGPSPEVPTCQLCVKLGDRSLTWFLRAYREADTDEERDTVITRFRKARGRATIGAESERRVRAGRANEGRSAGRDR